MNRDHIIRMARNCFDVHTDAKGRETFSGDHYCVEELVALVTQAEREACAKACEEMYSSCSELSFKEACWDCAKAIRARGRA